MVKIPTKPFTGYMDALLESWQDIWQKPVVFFPIIYSYVLFILLFGLLVGVGSFVLGPDFSITKENYLSGGILIGVFVVLLLGLLVHTLTLQVSVLSHVALKKKITVKKGFSLSPSFFTRALVALLIMFSLAGILLGLIALLGTLLFADSGVTFMTGVIMAVPLLLIVLFLGLWTQFLQPLIYHEKSGVDVISSCFTILLQDFKHVFMTALITALLSLGLSAIMFPLSLVIGESLSYQAIQLIVNTILSVWVTLFSYKMFFRRYI